MSRSAGLPRLWGMTTTRLSWPTVQHRSGLLLSLFLALHLFNMAAAAFGPAVYDPLQTALPRLYQQPVLELVAVIGALVVHVVAAIVVARRRSAARRPLPPLLRIHRLGGRFLAVVIVGHVVATRAPSLLWGEHPGFLGVAFTMLAAPPLFIPYYLLLGVAGVVHGGVGVAIALPGLIGRGQGRVRRLLVRQSGTWRKPAPLTCAICVASVAVVVGVLAFAGVGVVTDITLDEDAIRRGAFARRLMTLGFGAFVVEE
jgi:hypothetical protein